MADSSSDDKKARRRKPVATAVVSEQPEKSRSPKKRSGKSVDEDEDAYSPWVDILRVLTFLIIASAGLSYLVSGGETWLWYYGQTKPPYLTRAYWQAKFVCSTLCTHALLLVCSHANPSAAIRPAPRT